MPDSYAYAKIFSLIPRTYIRDNLKKLLVVKGLAEVYDILFPGERFDLQEHHLVIQLQRKIKLRGINTIIKILELLGRPHPILVHTLRKYEYQNIKSLLRFLKQSDNEKLPFLWDLGPFALLPNEQLAAAKKEELKESLAASPYRWVMEKENFDQPFFLLSNLLDRDYYRQLWDYTVSLPKADRHGILKLVSLEILYLNVIWALRLRFYFNFSKEKAQDLLINVNSEHFASPALEIFDFAADEPARWQSWKLAWLVKDQLHKEMRQIDPAEANEKAARHLSNRAWRLFHTDPFTLTPFYCFIKLKELEANLLQGIVEGFAMNLSQAEMSGVSASL